jgi:hypothetical protein
MATLRKLLLSVFVVVYFLTVFYATTMAWSYFFPLDSAALAF